MENVPVVSSLRSKTLENLYQIHGIFGVPILIDTMIVGSQAHWPRLWWTNMAPIDLLQSTVNQIKWPDIYMSDILDPHRAPQCIYHDN